MADDAPAFDPSQPFDVQGDTSAQPAPTFDPGKPFNVVGNHSDNNGQQRSVAESGADVPPTATNYPWSDVAADAVGNVLPSAAHVAEGVYSALRHPVDTATAMANVGRGAGQELAHSVIGDQKTHDLTEQEKSFEALKNYFGGRYGSMEGFKNALATDPTGVATDLSVLLTGGESAASKIPVLSSKVADALGTAARVTNPVTAIASGIGKLTKPIGTGLAKIMGDLTTGAGSSSVKNAFQAGLVGGETGKTFTGNLRGDIPWSQVVADAKTALGNMRADRNTAYRSGMTDISKDATVLSFDPVDDAMAKAGGIKTFAGRSGTGPVQDLAPKTAAVRQEIEGLINHWKSLDPAEYHTPEGFDALKQQIGDIKDDQKFGTPQRAVANEAYNIVRNTIAKQAPAYNGVMSDYSAASDQLSAMQKELSLGPKGNPNTALRKLQSVMRDNANTSWGNRAEYANTLADSGAPNLMPALAGQALSTVIPRGLAKYGDLGMMGAAGMAHLPAALATGLISSPRLVGEAAYGLGRTAKALASAAKAIAPSAGYAAGKAPLAFEAGESPQLIGTGDEQQTIPLADSTATLMHLANPQGYADGGRVAAAAAEADTEPTDAQIEAGNYKLGHVSLHGFNISIETPKGAARRGFGPDGQMWENRHETSHYGYIRSVGKGAGVAADGENHDAYIGPHPDSIRIFVANQINPKTKKFDETKIIFGARTLAEARKIYDGGFSDGSGPKRRWAIHETDPATLKAWLAGKRTTKPFPSELAVA